MALLACASLGISEVLHAQVRWPEKRSSKNLVEKPPVATDEATRARVAASMEAWLGRLVGRFRVDATLAMIGGTIRVEGAAACDYFGEGPAVRCVIQGIHRHELERDRGTLPLLYFGINPDALEIQLVMVDVKQVATRSGVLTGDTVHLSDNWKVCHKIWTSCWVADEITARPSGEIFMRIAEDNWAQGRRMAPVPHLTKGGHSLELEMQWHRPPPVDAQ